MWGTDSKSWNKARYAKSEQPEDPPIKIEGGGGGGNNVEEFPLRAAFQTSLLLPAQNVPLDMFSFRSDSQNKLFLSVNRRMNGVIPPTGSIILRGGVGTTDATIGSFDRVQKIQNGQFTVGFLSSRGGSGKQFYCFDHMWTLEFETRRDAGNGIHTPWQISFNFN